MSNLVPLNLNGGCALCLSCRKIHDDDDPLVFLCPELSIRCMILFVALLIAFSAHKRGRVGGVSTS